MRVAPTSWSFWFRTCPFGAACCCPTRRRTSSWSMKFSSAVCVRAHRPLPFSDFRSVPLCVIATHPVASRSRRCCGACASRRARRLRMPARDNRKLQPGTAATEPGVTPDGQLSQWDRRRCCEAKAFWMQGGEQVDPLTMPLTALIPTLLTPQKTQRTTPGNSSGRTFSWDGGSRACHLGKLPTGSVCAAI